MNAHFQPGQPAYTSAEQAWAVFKAAIQQGLDEDYSEEIKIGFGEATFYDGFQVIRNENQFQIYFGRLIDADPGNRWRSVEIDFYFRYDLTHELSRLLAEFSSLDFEIFYAKTHPRREVEQKIAAFFAFGDQRQAFWDAVRSLEPRASYSFWLI